ncbi:MAG: glutamyl-tRNA reductase [Armatimonadia bacterium]|nr:glutamyl-tRNA reductase [Armatimonadia bacterium]
MNHHTADLSVRDRASVRTKEIGRRLAEVLDMEGVAEALLLSTCNRSELYVVTRNGSSSTIQETFAKAHHVRLDEVHSHLYTHHDLDAVRHLCAVASGIDSMVVGEHEIMSQLKQALGLGMEAGAVKTTLGRLANKALAAGKRVRTETKLGEGFVSVASVAVNLAERVFGDLSDARLLLLGAGQNSELIAERLAEAGARSVIVSNRNYDRAQDLAGRFDGQAVRFDDFPRELGKADIIIASTNAPHPMITADQVRTVLRGRPRHPMFVIDLAVPRNVDPEVGEIKGVHLYDLDGLNRFLQKTWEERSSEVPRAQAIVEQEARDFIIWMKSREIVPLTLAILDQAEGLRATEMESFLDETSNLTTKQERAVERLTKKLVHSLLHHPLEQLRELACTAQGAHNVEIIKALFDIEGELDMDLGGVAHSHAEDASDTEDDDTAAKAG